MIARFPFPALEEGTLKQRIRALGERLDSHRKRQQEQHPGLTLTGIYNVLEKLRSGEPLTAKEKQIHDQGLVTVLRQIHDELDEAVLEAYGWSDLRSHDTLVVNKESPHSCGAGECEAIEKREALHKGSSFSSTTNVWWLLLLATPSEVPPTVVNLRSNAKPSWRVTPG